MFRGTLAPESQDMPRIAKPRWNASRRRWYGNVGERNENGRRREVFAPAEIGERDEAKAWEWFKTAQSRDRTAKPQPSGLLADMVCGYNLTWAKKQRDEGKLAATEFANKARHLGIFSDQLGQRAVWTLEPNDLTDFGIGLLDFCTPTYARNVCATVRAAMNWAVRDKETPLDANPIQGFKAPTIPRSPARFAERAEAAAFLAHWRTRSKRKTITGKYDRMTLLTRSLRLGRRGGLGMSSGFNLQSRAITRPV